MAKRVPAATTPDLQLLEPTWAPARIGIGRRRSDAGFLLLIVLSLAWAWQPFVTVIGRSLQSGEYEHYSHIVLLPFLWAYLLYVNRDAIRRHASPSPRTGILLAVAGAAAIWFAGTSAVGEQDGRLSLAMLGLVTSWVGSFVMWYGVRGLRTVAFPFVLLTFMVPLPPAALAAIIVFLQRASADVAALMFWLMAMPVFRDGLVFVLPGITIQVAEECSGIRSSLVLLISGLLMAYVLLRRSWTRTIFILAIVPLAIVKNALRIVMLSWLAVHVDPSFITGSALHRSSGMPVFVASLTILGGLVWLLRRSEQKEAAA